MSTCSSLGLERLGLQIMLFLMHSLWQEWTSTVWQNKQDLAEWLCGSSTRSKDLQWHLFLTFVCTARILSWSAGSKGAQSLASCDPFFSNLMADSRLFRIFLSLVDLLLAADAALLFGPGKIFAPLAVLRLHDVFLPKTFLQLLPPLQQKCL